MIFVISIKNCIDRYMIQHIWIKKIFFEIFLAGIPRLFLEFFFPTKYTIDMYIRSVFDGDYESAIVMYNIYAYI